ncbi:hypothetical protein BDA99DRAFT_554589 [Phascolomyces articulosus]|uniref:Uncharacterized protein n=1 Tax=Phascolomyces articulosus TaxID=60185 RepID=A0AAD5PL07_9FUNG|nr:hypothetical protein BDA99DRAFT_554589 [Phascolomyces articulosus]
MAENLFEFSQIKNEQSSAAPNLGRRYLPIRKYYAEDCTCSESQPRRGKNLPDGTLDSRAKKLHPQDNDYEFSIKWLTEHAHATHRDEHGQVVGLRELPEVSLCKAHSSTLYRAQKKHERVNQQLSPPPPFATSSSTTSSSNPNHNTQHHHHPSSSSSTSHHPLPPPPQPSSSTTATSTATNTAFSPSPDYMMDVELHRHPPPPPSHPHPSNMEQQHPYYHHTPPPPPPLQQQQQQQQPTQPYMSNLAAKVRNINHPPFQGEMPDFSAMSSSTSLKRKRTESMARSSASTPLLAHPYHSPSSPIPHVDFNQQLPPLHQQQQQPQPQASPRTVSLSSLPFRRTQPPPPPPSSSTTNDANSPGVSSNRRMSFPHYSQQPPSSSSSSSHPQQQGGGPLPPSTYSSPSPSLEPFNALIVDTVSLKTQNNNSNTPEYLIKNLAITDTFTFRELLSEADIIGSPPPGKRIVISDDKQERIFPLDQAIRSVIRRPVTPHVELWLSLNDKPSIDWSSYHS